MGKIPVNKLLNSTKNVGTFIKENKEVIQYELDKYLTIQVYP